MLKTVKRPLFSVNQWLIIVVVTPDLCFFSFKSYGNKKIKYRLIKTIDLSSSHNTIIPLMKQ